MYLIKWVVIMYLMVCSETQGGWVVMFVALPAAAELSTSVALTHDQDLQNNDTSSSPGLQ